MGSLGHRHTCSWAHLNLVALIYQVKMTVGDMTFPYQLSLGGNLIENCLIKSEFGITFQISTQLLRMN